MSVQRHTFEVIAHRLDQGDRWELEAVEVPGVHAEVDDIFEGAASIRSVLAERLGQDRDDFDVRIRLG